MMPEHYDAVIVGGGMVGATLASALAQIPGLSVLMLEGSATPCVSNDKSVYQYQYDARTITLARGSAEIYHQLGIWSELRRRAVPIQEIQVTEKGEFGVSKISAREEKVPALGYVIENRWLMQLLYEHLADCPTLTIEAPSVVQRVVPNNDGYLIESFHQQQQALKQFQAKLMIVADGAESSLRHLLGIEVERFDYHQSAVVTNVSCDAEHHFMAHERFTDQGPIALLPLTDERYGLVWTCDPDKAEELVVCSSSDFLKQVQSQFGKRMGRFTRVGERFCYSLQRITAKEQVRPNMVVLGNSAHTLHPVAGQGFNLSVRDIAALTVRIKQRLAAQLPLGDIDYLMGYQDHRQSDQTKITQFSDKLLKLFLNPSGTLKLARNVGLITFDLWPGAKKALARHAMGTLTYTTL